MHSIHTCLVVVGFAAALSHSAQAQDAPSLSDPYSPAFTRCMGAGDAARGVTSDMASCAHAELARHDAALNQAYRAATTALAPADRRRLLLAQRAWITFRDLNCDVTSSSGGTIDLVTRPSCLIVMTYARTRELRQLAAR